MFDQDKIGSALQSMTHSLSSDLKECSLIETKSPDVSEQDKDHETSLQKNLRLKVHHEFLNRQDTITRDMIKADNRLSKQEQEDLNFIRRTLQKPSDQRSDVALDKLSVLIKQVKFFKQMTDLTKSDFRDLASSFKFQFCRGMTNVCQIGDFGDKFYIVLRGVLSIRIPNPTVKDRAKKMKEHEELKVWKRDVWLSKVSVAKRNRVRKFEDMKRKNKDAGFLSPFDASKHVQMSSQDQENILKL